MAVLHDVYCAACDKIEVDVWVQSGAATRCPTCRGPRSIAITKSPFMDAWGGPRHIPTMRDEPFASKSEMRRWMRDNDLGPSPSADKHGGARNEGHMHLGRIYSGGGIRRRSSYDHRYGGNQTK